MRFELRRLTDYSDEAILDEIRRVAGIVPTSKLSARTFRQHSRVSETCLRERFGSWQRALEAAGLGNRFDSCSQPKSREDILAEIKRVASLIKGQKLSQPLFRKHSRVSPRTAAKYFGNWQQALQAAGLGDRFDASSQPVSRDEVISEIRRVARLLGVEVLRADQFNSLARFNYTVAKRRFGTWHKALQAAGLKRGTRGRIYSDEECFENLLKVWTHYGRAPLHREMYQPPSEVGAAAYVRRFGTWTMALQAFAERVDADTTTSGERTDSAGPEPPRLPHDSLIREPQVGKVKMARIPDCDKREIKLGLRYAVLKRDLFRCVICGRSPATHLGVILHVDHILAWAKGGKTVIENLRSLCEDCNLGKGSRCEG